MPVIDRRRLFAYGLLSLGALGIWTVRRPLFTYAVTGNLPARGQRTVSGVVRACGPKSLARFASACKRAGIDYPPRRVYLLAFKGERRLEVWGADASGPYRRLHTYPVLAASGTAGVKRREGDRQVPEGLYRITTLNPNSAFHLSMRVDYPNATDVANSDVPRGRMGGDIYVHGGAASIGCLALGDPAIEELFPLVAQARDRRILIAPTDLRREKAPQGDAPWVSALYRDLNRALWEFPSR